MCERLGNYDISTETRELKIQWINGLLLVRAGREPQEQMPPPFDQIKFSQWGTILGKEIYMARKLDKAAEARIQKSNKHMETREPKDIPKQAFNHKVKIMIWNSLIRSTMIYRLRARGLPKRIMEKMEVYMFKQIRTMINPNLKTEAWRPGRTNSIRNCNNRRWNHGSTKHELWQCWHRSKTTKWYIQRTAKRCSCQESSCNNNGSNEINASLEQMNIRKQETKEQRQNPHDK